MPILKKSPDKAKTAGRNARAQKPRQAAEQPKARAKKPRGRLPSKRTLNLATVNIKRINWFVAIPLILLILVGAAALSKFAVLDRYAEVAVVQNDIAQLQEQLERGYEQIDGFGKLNQRYAHYSYADMTMEEMSRVDRVEVVRLLRRTVLPSVEVKSWTLSGNVLTLSANAGRLQDFSDLIQKLMKSDIVEYGAILDAATFEDQTVTNTAEGDAEAVSAERVAANIIVLLRQAGQEVVQ